MTIYGHIWFKLICQHVFIPKLRLIVIFWATNWSKNAKDVDFSPWIQIIQSGALTLCQYIFNGYLWSHTIETDDVFMRFYLPWGLCWSLVPQLVKIVPKMSISPPGSGISNLVPQYCTRRFLLQIMVIYNWNWYVSVRFDLFKRFMAIFRGKIWSKICQKCLFCHPLNPEYPIWCLNIVPRHPQLLSMVIMAIKTDIPACVLTSFRVYWGLQDQRFVRNKPK